MVLRAPRVADARPFTYDGRPYQRVGTTTSRMPQDRYEALLLERAHARRRWENQPAVGVALEDLDREEILLTRDQAVRSTRISAGTNRVIEECLRYGVDAPSFEEQGGTVVVTFKAPASARCPRRAREGPGRDQVGTKSGPSSSSCCGAR